MKCKDANDAEQVAMRAINDFAFYENLDGRQVNGDFTYHGYCPRRGDLRLRMEWRWRSSDPQNVVFRVYQDLMLLTRDWPTPEEAAEEAQRNIYRAASDQRARESS